MGKPTTFNKMPPITDAAPVVEAKPIEADEAGKCNRVIEMINATDDGVVIDGKIIVPISSPYNSLSKNVNVTRMTQQQSRAFSSIFKALAIKQARLKNGTPVTHKSHVFKWMLENVTD
jgi:hypothetical protein